MNQKAADDRALRCARLLNMDPQIVGEIVGCSSLAVTNAFRAFEAEDERYVALAAE